MLIIAKMCIIESREEECVYTSKTTLWCRFPIFFDLNELN